MNEDALRAMIRESIARHGAGGRVEGETHSHAAPLPLITNAAHYRYSLPDSGGPCLIEPAVACNHCGYCQSHGY